MKGFCSHCQKSGLSVCQSPAGITLLSSHVGRMNEEVCPNSHKPPQATYGPDHPLAELDRGEAAEQADIALMKADAKEYHEFFFPSGNNR